MKAVAHGKTVKLHRLQICEFVHFFPQKDPVIQQIVEGVKISFKF